MNYNAPWISAERQIYESQFGLYYYDGTEAGRAKPMPMRQSFSVSILIHTSRAAEN
jgi:hypothetical protein